MYFLESKDRIISQLPKLSPEEKEEVKRYFNAHANLENQVDWNKSNWDNLTFEYFIQNFINNPTKTAKKKAVKSSGINGLSEGEDYLLVYQGEYTKENGDTGIIEGYVPLSYEASKHIASKSVGSDRVEGEWCIAWQKSREYWDSHAKDNFFVIFVDYHDRGESTNELDWGKEAVQFAIKRDRTLEYDEFRFKELEKIWNRYDNQVTKPKPPLIFNYIISDLAPNNNFINVTPRDIKRYSSTESPHIFGSDVCHHLKKSIGITRQISLPAVKTFVWFNSSSTDKEMIYVLLVDAPSTYKNPQTKKEKEFLEWHNLGAESFYFNLIESDNFGTGLMIRRGYLRSEYSISHDFMRGYYHNLNGMDYRSFMDAAFPQGEIFELPDFKNGLKSLVNEKIITFLIFSDFTTGNDTQLLKFCKSFAPKNTNMVETYFKNNYDITDVYVSDIFIEDDTHSFSDKLYEEIGPLLKKIIISDRKASLYKEFYQHNDIKSKEGYFIFTKTDRLWQDEEDEEVN